MICIMGEDLVEYERGSAFAVLREDRVISCSRLSEAELHEVADLVACLRAAAKEQARRQGAKLPVELVELPAEVAEAMERVEIEEGESAVVGWMEFRLPGGHADVYSDQSKDASKEAMRDRAACALRALQWLNSPEGTVWAGGGRDE